MTGRRAPINTARARRRETFQVRGRARHGAMPRHNNNNNNNNNDNDNDNNNNEAVLDTVWLTVLGRFINIVFIAFATATDAAPATTTLL